MPFFEFFWTDENIAHIAEHGVSLDEFEAIVQDPSDTDISRSSGDLVAIGPGDDGRVLICVYEMLDALTVHPITAYEIER
jgi:uncharacterized DUF497 family protein